MPHRFDALARSMDSNSVGQWLELAEVCDVVFWGPGMPGYEPMPLGDAARLVDADLVFFPDYHHAIPGLWDDLLEGVEGVDVPIVWRLGDPESAVDKRRAHFQRIRPAAILVGESSNWTKSYHDLIAEHGTRTLTVGVGFQGDLFSPPAAGAERDIDILVCGADVPESVYPMRRVVKRAVAPLAERWRVHDLGHPGYWELEAGAPSRRGQSGFAEALRRARVVVTGTCFGGLARKYFEAAACGAIGVGDLPAREPEAHRFEDAMIVVSELDDDDAIRARIEQVLQDPALEERLRTHAIAAMVGASHRERARAIAAELESVADDFRRVHRPRPVPREPQPQVVLASAEPFVTPKGYGSWLSIWEHGPADASRTRRAEAAVTALDGDIAVVTFDADGASPPDAFYLACIVRQTDGLVMRTTRHDLRDTPALAGIGIAAVPRAALLDELGRQRGRAGLEQALLTIAARDGATVLHGSAYDDPACTLLQLDASARLGLIRADAQPTQARALDAARMASGERRATTVGELLGWLRLRIDTPIARAGGTALVPQDPELRAPVHPESLFTRLDAGTLRDIVAHVAHAPAGAPDIQLGVPLSAGVEVEAAAAELTGAFAAARVDLNRGPDLVILERALHDCELAWLEQRFAALPRLARAA